MFSHRPLAAAILAGGVVMAGLALAGCAAARPSTPAPNPTRSPSLTAAPSPTPQPTLPIDQTSMTNYEITDFEGTHLAVNGSTNEYLIFGRVPITPAGPDVPADVAALLGRWEGYSYGPPVNKDWKVVLVITEIGAQDGRALFWAGTNVQYPSAICQVHFRVEHEAGRPTIEWEYQQDGPNRLKFMHDAQAGILRGWLDSPQGTAGPIQLNREQALTVFKDYPAYLAGKGISAQSYHDTKLAAFGKGYMLYLPDGYAADPGKSWPLILFLHGSGDRGDNVYLLAKASPFMMIREKGPLPAIIAAPLLDASNTYASFPDAYLDGVLAELRASYLIDARRIYLTGISMGGEATYRFALHQPSTFAAIAPLSAFNPKYAPWAISAGYQPFDVPPGRLKGVPIRAIHGQNDPVVALEVAQQTVDDFKKAGDDITFTVLPGHDHDTWTDTYSDPSFYDWLLAQARP